MEGNPGQDPRDPGRSLCEKMETATPYPSSALSNENSTCTD